MLLILQNLIGENARIQQQEAIIARMRVALSREIDERDQGLALGVANGASLLGRVLGPAFAGYLAANVAAGAPFALLFGCVLLAVFRAVLLVRPARTPG